MASTMTASGELTFVSFPIEKTETTADGDIVVYGKASDGSLDSDEQIVDPKFASSAIREWLDSGGNLRVQHNPQRDPAGIGLEMDVDGEGASWVKGLVVEPIAQKLVRKGVLRAYSVGIARPTIVRDSVARGGRITGGEICEVSLVDRPANKNCGIQLVKAAWDGSPQYTGEIFGDPDVISKAAGMTVTDTSYKSNGGSETVSVNLPRDVSVSFTPNDLAKIIGRNGHTAEKKDFDRNVGGGVDRDKIPAEDFAGKDRSFPIVTAADVSDALHSIGRAGADNYDSATLRRNILRIARRKGFPLPASASEDSSKSAQSAVISEATPDLTKPPKLGPPKKKKRPSVKVTVKGIGAEEEDDDDNEDDVAEGDDCKSAKGRCPTPADGVTGMSSEAVPPHREPDGAMVEAFEDDAGLQEGDHEGPTRLEQPMLKEENLQFDTLSRLKSLGVPSSVGTVHDLTCPAFHPDITDKAYPEQSLATIDILEWQMKALDAAANDEIAKADQAHALWQYACTVRDADPQIIREVRCALHKAFSDANPGPGSAPTPGHISAQRFNRPLISTGHEAPSSGHKPPNSANVPTGQVSAGQFTSGYLSSGHAENSPGNPSGSSGSRSSGGGTPSGLLASPPPPGVLNRVAGPFGNAQHAMTALHDHIAQTFPDLCPMDLPNVARRPVPQPQGVAKAEDTEAAEVVIDTDKTAKPKFKTPAEKKQWRKLMAQVFRGKMTVEEARSQMKRTGGTSSSSDSSSSSASKGSGLYSPDQLRESIGLGQGNNLEPSHVNMIKAAVSDTVEPLVLELEDARKRLKKQQKLIDALAWESDDAPTEPVEKSVPPPEVHHEQLDPDLIKSAVSDTVEPLFAELETARRQLKKQQRMIEILSKADAAPAPEPEEAPEVVNKGYRTPITADVIKAAVSDAVGPLIVDLQLANKRIKKQDKMINVLANQPDPATAPFKGQAFNPPASPKTQTYPVDVSVAEKQEHTQRLMLHELEEQWRADPDPMRREVAWQSILKLRGIS